MRFDTLQDWLQWLESCHPNEIDLGLDRVGNVAARMSLTLNQCKVVVVAGTNGKGSCVASLNALLRSAGYEVGCFTSPHFLHYNERVMINDQPVDDQRLIESFARIDDARDQIPLTYFEFGTLAAIDIFQRSELDVALLEVGLGGRLDAVNIIDADVAVVTSIDIDHQDWLGSDREKIAWEKAGIYRRGKPAISAGNNPPVSLAQVAKDCGAHLYQAGVDFQSTQVHSQQLWSWSGLDAAAEPIQLTGLPKLSLPEESVVAALQALQLLGLPLDAVNYQHLSGVALPGRFQQLSAEGKSLILDVAHNPAAAKFLASRLRQQPCKGRSFALFAVMADKDIDGIIEALLSSFDAWFLADLKNSPRALPANDLAAKLHEGEIKMISVSKNIRQAYRRVLSLMGPDDRLVVFGSFITVAEVLKIQSKKERDNN
jgi:dihydrofolate synthase/folylpolyglutamate synthase